MAENVINAAVGDDESVNESKVLTAQIINKGPTTAPDEVKSKIFLESIQCR